MGFFFNSRDEHFYTLVKFTLRWTSVKQQMNMHFQVTQKVCEDIEQNKITRNDRKKNLHMGFHIHVCFTCISHG